MLMFSDRMPNARSSRIAHRDSVDGGVRMVLKKPH